MLLCGCFRSFSIYAAGVLSRTFAVMLLLLLCCCSCHFCGFLDCHNTTPTACCEDANSSREPISCVAVVHMPKPNAQWPQVARIETAQSQRKRAPRSSLIFIKQANFMRHDQLCSCVQELENSLLCAGYILCTIYGIYAHLYNIHK